MLQIQRPDVWQIGQAYENYVGRWSRPVAAAFVDWLGLPAHRRWLDVGCGTGALTEIILSHAAPTDVTGIDSSEGFIAHARRHLRDPRVNLQLGNAEAMPFPEGTFDAVVSGLVVNFVPHPQNAIAEMRRTLHAGGTAAVYVWDYAGEMQLMRYFWDSAVALDPNALTLKETRQFSICKPEPLLALFEDGGFDRCECRNIDVSTVFGNFDEYWSPFLGGQGSAPTYCSSLSDERRSRLRDQLRATLPIDRDGAIRLTARAWAVRGVKSS
ncbi:MAG TPA: class I SAM-dependent methyltransferase [Xanthobacteraceae bacterium]|nr:class I SAM-dependent methyltransferase [Xanthobacteraceae bacterium]